MNNYRNRTDKSSCDENETIIELIDVNRGSVDSMPLAMAYVPWQHMKDVYEPSDALEIGTIFPELDLPFLCYRYSGGRRA